MCDRMNFYVEYVLLIYQKTSVSIALGSFIFA